MILDGRTSGNHPRWGILRPALLYYTRMALTLRYVSFALGNVAYLALVLWLLLFAGSYINPIFLDSLRWDSSGALRQEPTAASLVAFGIGLAEALALLLLVYPANKQLLCKATPHAAAVTRWTCAVSWVIAGIMVYGMAFDWLRSSR